MNFNTSIGFGSGRSCRLSRPFVELLSMCLLEGFVMVECLSRMIVCREKPSVQTHGFAVSAAAAAADGDPY